MNSQGQNAYRHLCFFSVCSVQLVESGWEVFALPPPLPGLLQQNTPAAWLFPLSPSSGDWRFQDQGASRFGLW